MVVGILAAGLLVTAGIITMVLKGRPKLAKENIPARLGALDHVPIQPLLEKLNAAIDDDYIQQVKQRFLQENPKQNEDEFEWRLFELKRYFLLANLLKQTPMFSHEVDEVWHDMLLFTQKYQSFSEKFMGKMLHHTPNTSPEPAPQERAFFDWVFSQLFQITEYSWKSWGSFFKHPMDTGILKDFRQSSNLWLQEKYFNRNEDNKDLVDYLIAQMKEQLNEAEKIYHVDKKGTFTRQRTFGEMTSLSLIMVFFSYYYFDEYWKYSKAYAHANVTISTSGCTTAMFCGTGSSADGSGDSGGSHHGGGDHGGSSCSSCSSCGGGCSS
ncbi:hypothetical protein PH210_19245 [Paenibacillus sp. BSR1-1]|uniref:hypothetical protein n=1 Tax=Paenibacillus sp. BSR1-1 TaxID=3020845 RepID=UPI0025AFA490|nr:hypothetical protein [Paenibacillus sp. BSR1-1]MDN3018318.1 hypothetical protein [Paenibacillus sp. BSR1-1]